jgi:hypothetical protein
MSTKTVTKRVALATVVALGAGVLSLVSVSSASADTYGSTNKISSSSVNVTSLTSGLLYMASYNSTTATATALNQAGTVSTTSPASFGLLSIGDVIGNDSPVIGVNQTASLLSTGKLSVYTQVAASSASSIVVSGATLAIGTTTTVTVNNTATAMQLNNTAASTTTVGAVITPNPGVSSFTVSLYTANTGTGTAYAATGTLSGFITVSVGSVATAGVPSVTKSGVYYANYGTVLSTGWSYSTSSVTGAKNDSNQATAGISAYNVVQDATIVEKDAYGTSLSATGNYVTVSATNGAYVGITAGTSQSGFSYGGSTSQVTGAGASFTSAVSGNGYDYLVVSNPTTAAMTTTVTVSINGVVVGTKAFTFTGEVSKVVLSAPSNGVVSLGGNVTAYFYDAAGNKVYPSSGSGSYPQNITQDANTTGAGIGLGTFSNYSSTTTVIGVKCGGTNISGQIAIDYTNASGSIVASNAAPFTCSGNAYTYSAKLDKSSYNTGDIATLTVTFKDSLGAVASDAGTVINTQLTSNTPTQIASSTKVPNIYSGGFSNTSGTSTTAGTSTDNTTNGVATYKFIVGSTSGANQLLVDFPYVDTNGAGAAQTVAYTIASSGTSLNDVLKGIVALIASINKQIAALAKLVTKK